MTCHEPDMRMDGVHIPGASNVARGLGRFCRHGVSFVGVGTVPRGLTGNNHKPKSCRARRGPIGHIAGRSVAYPRPAALIAVGHAFPARGHAAGRRSGTGPGPGTPRATKCPRLGWSARAGRARDGCHHRRAGTPPVPVNTAARIATPNVPPSWRSVLKAPDALPIAAGGTAPITEFWAAGMAIETPQPATISGAIMAG